MSYTELVNPLQGSDSRHEFSTGNTYPAIGVPRGLTYWSPETSEGRFFFDSRLLKLIGFRATHCPSPWMGDYGHFSVMPTVGNIHADAGMNASSYRREKDHARPHAYRVRLARYGIGVMLTASRSCGVFRFDYPDDAGDSAGLVIRTGRAEGQTLGSVEIREEEGKTVVAGKAMSHHGSVPEDFGCYFRAEIEGARVCGFGTLTGSELRAGEKTLAAPGAGAYLRFRPTGPVTVRIATSFIGPDQASQNLLSETGGCSAADVSAAAKALWDTWLGRIEADGGSERDRRTLYSCLYRAGLFPMPMHEFDAAGRPRHYSPHTGRVESGVFYTNNGFWDTYRTVYSLLGLIDPAGYAEIADGFLQHFRQGGWLPKWCSPGYRDCMIGSHADIVLSEAVMRGLPGVDPAEAYAAIRRSAFDPVSGHGRFGRAALPEYIRYGYVPAEAAHASVSWTLDNAHCDWCIGRVAAKLGHAQDAEELTKRGGNYRNLWHAGSGFMRPRRADGSWVEPWREFEWGNAYVEGGPWQHSFHVPHDPQGLAELCGGVEGLLGRLEQMLATPPRFEVGSYGTEIHEMTEMAFATDGDGRDFGQYAQSNQPVHGFLWLPAQLGRPEVTGRWVARVMRGLYSPDRFPGDEDNGEMASWYLLGALGKIPDCQGTGRLLDIPVPVFRSVRVAGAALG